MGNKFWNSRQLTNWPPPGYANALDNVKAVTKSNGVYQYRINNLKNSTKYSFKVSQYRKYSSSNYELDGEGPHPRSKKVSSTFGVYECLVCTENSRTEL